MDAIRNVPGVGFIGFGQAAHAFVSGRCSAADVPDGLPIAATTALPVAGRDSA